MKFTDSQRAAHLELLATAFYQNLQRNSCEFGGWGLDDKRPFGNSSVERDILQLIGIKDDDDHSENLCKYARELYDELGAFLPKQVAQLQAIKAAAIAVKIDTIDINKNDCACVLQSTWNKLSNVLEAK